MNPTYGKVFKSLRLAKGLNLKEVAGGDLSIAQLSKFENGLSVLSLSKFFEALDMINVRLSEFETALIDYENPKLSIYDLSFTKYRVVEYAALEKEYEAKYAENPKRVSYELIRIALKSISCAHEFGCLYGKNPSYATENDLLSKEEFSFVERYLDHVASFSYLEIWLSRGLITYLMNLKIQDDRFVDKIEEKIKKDFPAYDSKGLQDKTYLVSVIADYNCEFDHFEEAQRVIDSFDPDSPLNTLLGQYHSQLLKATVQFNFALEEGVSPTTQKQVDQIFANFRLLIDSLSILEATYYEDVFNISLADWKRLAIEKGFVVAD